MGVNVFRTMPDTEPAANADVSPRCSNLLPLSHLALDLPEPAEGWPAFLSSRDIAVVADDIGRSAISRSDAKRLFTERRDNELRQREVIARIELEAEKRDQAFRAALPKGLAWHEVP